MLGRTHEVFAACWWLGAAIGVNEAATRWPADLGELPTVGLVAAVIGVPLAMGPAGGRNSPDMDSQTPLRFFVRHRGVTHSPELAIVLTALTVVAYVALARWVPPELEAFTVLVFAPVTGWWSHLVGDRLFGGHSPVRVGGFIESVTRGVLPVVAGALLVLLVMGPAALSAVAAGWTR